MIFLVYVGLSIFLLSSASNAGEPSMSTKKADLMNFKIPAQINKTISYEDLVKLIKIPNECRNKPLCTIKPEGYDQLVVYLEDIIPKALKHIRVRYQTPVVYDAEDIGGFSSPPTLHDSDGHRCPYKERILKPFYNGQQNEFYLQTLSMEQTFTEIRCAYDSIVPGKDGEQCFQIHNFAAVHHAIPICEESDTYQTAYLFNTTTTTLKITQVPIPSCCSCIIKDINDK